MPKCVLREESRKLFSDFNLKYEDITELDIRKLTHLIEGKLIDYILTGDAHAKQMNMKVSPIRKKDIEISKNGLVQAIIRVDGSYFKGREGITFNNTGFIGFGGELSNVNVVPILKAFNVWCYLIQR